MNNSKGLLVVLSGPSGAGKDTVLQDAFGSVMPRVRALHFRYHPPAECRERRTEGITTSSPESSLRLCHSGARWGAGVAPNTAATFTGPPGHR